MLSTLFSSPEPLILDLGSAMTRLIVPARGSVVSEPTALLREGAGPDRRYAEVGQAALTRWRGADRFDPDLTLVRPLIPPRDPDAPALTALLTALAAVADPRAARRRWRLTVARPPQMSDVAAAAWSQALRGLSAEEPVWVDMMRAAAMGAGLSPLDAGAALVLDVGGWHARGALVADGEVQQVRLAAAGGITLDRALIQALPRDPALQPDLETIAAVRAGLSSLEPPRDGEGAQHLVGGYSPRGRWIRRLVSERSLAAAALPVVSVLIDLVRGLLETAPPELMPDLTDRGVLLVGGAARTPGLDRILRGALDIPVTLAEDPELCVAKGLWAVHTGALSATAAA